MNLDNQDKMTNKIYQQLLDYIQQKQQYLAQNSQVDIIDVLPLIEKTVYFMENSKGLISRAIEHYDENDITISHAVNVTIFTLVLALEMELDYDQLVQLGAASLVHDIGVAKIPDRIVQTKTELLSEKEIYYFQQHSKLGYESIEKYNPRLQNIADIIYQHHERADKSGYPEQLQNTQILLEARIIALADAYESLIHPRRHRDALIPPQGMQNIIEREGTKFDPNILELLYETLTIYPEGAFVQLHSGEIGKIVETNENNPLHPKVKILLSAQGEKIESQTIDLARNSKNKIKKPIPVTDAVT